MTRRRSQQIITAVVLALLLVFMAANLAGRLPTTSAPATQPAQQTTATSATSATRATTSRSTAPAGQATDPASGLRWVNLADLPREASDTMSAIKAGGPFRYPRNDGVVFRNNERRLPIKSVGYYHEFTVVTPGSTDRGPRRIVSGGTNFGTTNSEWFYTGDHYATFWRIRP